MTKLQLVLSDACYTSFDQPWIVDIVKQYFDIVYIEHNPTISKRAMFVTNVLAENKWYHQDYKLIIDNLWETYQHDNRGFVLTNKNWFWYNESLWYRHLNYNNYTPAPNVQKNGLLLMNLKKLHRDQLFVELDLTKLLYSYVGNGDCIDNDISSNDTSWQRYFNPVWYNSTAFSIVAETTVQQTDPVFITEKTFKPMAFQHPYVIFGQSGILQYLKSQGFETFDNIFDESYDNMLDVDARLHNIVNQINTYEYNPHDSLTLSKLKHNKELFFDEQLVKDRIRKEIVESMIEYAEA